MTATGTFPDGLPVARTAIDADEEATDALLRAARRAHVDIDDVEPRLYDQIDAGALDAIVAHRRDRDDTAGFVFVADLWGRTFVVRPDAVEVYP